jgi:hypothetical protein
MSDGISVHGDVIRVIPSWKAVDVLILPVAPLTATLLLEVIRCSQ